MISLSRHVNECRRQNAQVATDLISTGLIKLDDFNESGLKPLHVAVKNNKHLLVELLLESGANVDANSDIGETALSIAITHIHPIIVKILLDHGASLIAVDPNGKSALKLATEMCKKYNNQFELRDTKSRTAKILNMILQHGTNSENNSQADYYKLCKAIIYGDTKSAKRLIRFANDVNFDGVRCESPLEFAVYYDCLEEAELLLRRGANPNQDLRLNRESALVFAIHGRNSKMVKLLLSFGAETNFLSTFSGYYGRFPRTPLYRAAHFINFDFGILLMKELLDHGANVSGLLGDYQTVQETALHVASYWGFAEAVKMLISHSADVNCRDDGGETPLHKSVEFPEIVEILLKNGAEVNARSVSGATALHRACTTGSAGKAESVKLLIQSGANVDATDFDDQTPLHYACGQSDDPRCIKYLVEQGAKLTVTDKDGRTILHRAAENYKASNLKYIMDFIVDGDIIDINVRDYNGFTPLHYAYDEFFSSCEKFVEFLKRGADHNILSKDWEYPYHVCWDDLEEAKCPVDEYVQRLKAIGYDILSDDVAYGFYGKNLSSFYQRELEELKQEMIVWNPRASLYDLLFMKRNILARYSANENLERAFEECGRDFETRYPYFGSLLNVQYRRGRSRRKVTAAVKDYLENALGNRVADICSDIIFKYLNNSSMKNLLK